MALIGKEKKTSNDMYHHRHTFVKKIFLKPPKKQFCLLKIGKIIRSIKKKTKRGFRYIIIKIQTEFNNFCNPIENVQITVYIPGGL